MGYRVGGGESSGLRNYYSVGIIIKNECGIPKGKLVDQKSVIEREGKKEEE